MHHGPLELVKILIDKGVDIHHVAEDGSNCLFTGIIHKTLLILVNAQLKNILMN